MSDILATTIDIHYPVAGVDNDSKGFRDNFRLIRDGLIQAKADIEKLETQSVLKTPLNGSGTASNDLATGLIYNGSYNKFYSTTYLTSITDIGADVSLWNGTFQRLVLSQDTAVTFSHWPVSGLYGVIRLHLIAASSNPVTITLGTSNGGRVIQETEITSDQLGLNNEAYKSYEAFSYDGGANVFFRYLGRYQVPTS